MASEIDRLLPGAEVVVPRSVLDEIDRLRTRGVPFAAAARTLAGTFSVMSVEGRGDRAILDEAVAHGGWVVTADRALAARVRERGAGVLVPRDRNRLELARGEPPSVARPDRPPRRRGNS